MQVAEVVTVVADVLKEFDSEAPVHKGFRPGIGPFGEPQIVKEIAKRLSNKGLPSRTKRTPDLVIQEEWSIEFKIVRPYGTTAERPKTGASICSTHMQAIPA